MALIGRVLCIWCRMYVLRRDYQKHSACCEFRKLTPSEKLRAVLSMKGAQE